MTEKEMFTLVGIREEAPKPTKKVSRMAGFPWISVILFAAIVLCCMFAEVLMTKDPTYLDLKSYNVAPTQSSSSVPIPWAVIFSPAFGTAVESPSPLACWRR